MRAIAETYIERHGDNAVRMLVTDLMTSDKATLKAGYTRENAIIAAAEVFEIPREQVEAVLA